jgi:hypothetical protein
MPSEKMIWCHNEISDHLDQIKKLFNKPVKATIIVRTSDDVDGMILLTDDNLETVMGQIALMAMREPMCRIGEPMPQPSSPTLTSQETPAG